jgi:hypothetical protein
MNKKDYYKAQGLLEAGKLLDYNQQIALMAFADTLVCLIEETTEDGENGDLYGTEGWEHAIGWD